MSVECIGCDLLEAIRSNLKLIQFVAAGIAFLIGLCQYRKAQTWKRVEFVASEMRTFFDDEAARAARTMLDSSPKYMALYKYRGEEDWEKETVTYALVASALGTDAHAHYCKAQSAIREIFERFLEFLARFEGFIQTKIVKESDLTPYLDYWVRLLAGADQKSPKVTSEVLPQLWKFIHFYQYEDVARFIARYEKIKPEFTNPTSPGHFRRLGDFLGLRRRGQFPGRK